jgi:hypothetical protein
MQQSSGAALVERPEGAADPQPAKLDAEVVSTHVLIPESQAGKLRELSRKTRVAQSEYLREAVDDLLGKYGRRPDDNDL